MNIVELVRFRRLMVGIWRGIGLNLLLGLLLFIINIILVVLIVLIVLINCCNVLFLKM